MMVQANELRPGMVVILNGQLFVVFEVEHRTPGNKRGLVQAKLKNLKTGANFENKFSSVDVLEKAILDEEEMEYLYADGDLYNFMNTKTFDQVSLNNEIIGEAKYFLRENMKLSVCFHDGVAIKIELPLTVILKVVETAPEMKTATITASTKPATLETGLVVQVPPFVKEGDLLRIDTASKKYIERA